MKKYGIVFICIVLVVFIVSMLWIEQSGDGKGESGTVSLQQIITPAMADQLEPVWKV